MTLSILVHASNTEDINQSAREQPQKEWKIKEYRVRVDVLVINHKSCGEVIIRAGKNIKIEIKKKMSK